MDTKHLRFGGIRFYQFTAIDCFSRVAFCRVFSSGSSKCAQAFLEELKGYMPFPLVALQTDNGSAFLKHFDKATEEELITHYFSHPHCPKENAHVERKIQTTKYELWAFRAPALLVLPLSIPLLFAAFEPLEGVSVLSRSTMSEIFSFNRRLFLVLLIALLLYIAAESAVSMWLITFLREEHGVSLSAAHWVLTGLWAGITVGRLICSFLAKWIEPFKILVFLTAASGIVLLVAPLVGSKVAAMIIYPFVGLFYSGIYPLLVGYVALFPTSVSSAVFSIFIAAGALGGACLPYAVGLVNQFAGLVVGMCSISLAVFGVLACLYWLKPQVAPTAAQLANLPSEG